MGTEKKKNKWFMVSGLVTISIFTKVQAKDANAALELAKGRDMVGLCFQCGGSDQQGECFVTSGEMDGVPEGLQVEECDEDD